MRKALALVVAMSLGAVLVAGCGSEPARRATATETPRKALPQDDLERALIDAPAFGSRATQSEYWGGLGTMGDGLGCLQVLDAVKWVSTPVHEAQVAVDFEKDHNYPVLVSSAASFGTVTEAAAVVPAYREKLADCSHATFGNDSVRIVLDVTQHGARVGEKDDHLEVSARGSLRSEDSSFPFAVVYNVVQVDNQVVLTAYFTVTRDDLEDQGRTVSEAVVDRLRAVIAGKPVPPTRLGVEPWDPAADSLPGSAV